MSHSNALQVTRHRGCPSLIGYQPVARGLRVRVRVAVGHDVKVAQSGRRRLQRALRDDEPVTVVVDVREANPVLALAEHAQLARA